MANGNQQVPNPNLASALERRIGSRMAGAGVGMAGRAMANLVGDEEGAAEYTALGQEVAQALEDRWHQKEFENWQAAHMQPWQEQMDMLNTSSKNQLNALDTGMILTPAGEAVGQIDPKSEQAVRIRQRIYRDTMQAISKQDMELMNSATKYQNPMIAQSVGAILSERSQMVSGFFKTPEVLESEGEVADIGLKRAQAKAAKTAGAKPKRPLDLREALSREGIAGILPWVISSPEGQDLLGSDLGKGFLDAAHSQVTDEILRRHPDLINNKDALTHAVGKRADDINKRAAGLLVQSALGQGVASILQERNPEFFAPQKVISAASITGRRPRYEQDQIIDAWKDESIRMLTEVLRTETPTNVDKAIDFVVEHWLTAQMKKEIDLNPETAAFSKRLKSAVMTHLSKNWERSILAREMFKDKGKKQRKTMPRERRERAKRGLSLRDVAGLEGKLGLK